jgi:uncharacterized lipoprotein YehR (DUF1307 family)
MEKVMKMKKVASVTCLMVLLLVLSACGKEEVLTKIFERQENDSVVVFTYKYQDDTVIEQTANIIQPYSELGLTTKEEAGKEMAPVIEQYKELKGVTFNITFCESQVIQYIMINYEKADISELSKVAGKSFDTNDNKKRISMKGSEELLKNQGYVEK